MLMPIVEAQTEICIYIFPSGPLFMVSKNPQQQLRNLVLYRALPAHATLRLLI